MKLTNLMSELVKRNGSDLHLTGDSYPFFRVQGQILPVSSEIYSTQDLRKDLESILGADKLAKFDQEKELDCSYGLEGIARFRMNIFLDRGKISCVMRALNTQIPTFSKIGLPDSVQQLLSRPRGLMLVTGPTGSGKTTTLASGIDWINNNFAHHILTIEDPIEFIYNNKNCLVRQREVGEDTNSFSNALRSALREDPDIILVGEMRDLETISLAITAAETGHLVFTTLHANSSCTSLTRLLDMEVPKYKLNSSVRGVLAQRLVRKVCTGCAIKRPIKESEAREFNINLNTPVMYANNLTAEEKALRKKEGSLCVKCNGAGYKGRIGIYELLILDRKIQNAIADGKSTREVENLAVQENSMLTLTQYGVELVKEQLTTISEVIRVCKTD